MERIFWLLLFCAICSCTKESPMPDIYGDYVIRNIYWRGGNPVDLDNDGHSSQYLIDELRSLASNDFFYRYSTIYGSNDRGGVSFIVPLQNLVLDGETGNVDTLALQGSSFGVSFDFDYSDGQFEWSTFESYEFGEGFNTSRYDIVHLKDGHIVSTEKGKIVLSINVSYYDYATESIISGPEEITYMRLQ